MCTALMHEYLISLRAYDPPPFMEVLCYSTSNVVYKVVEKVTVISTQNCHMFFIYSYNKILIVTASSTVSQSVSQSNFNYRFCVVDVATCTL